MSNPYDLVATSYAEERNKQNSAALTLTSTKPPEQSAEIFDLSKKSKLPVGAVEQDPASVRLQLERERLNALSSESPMVRKWISDTQNYDLAKDDIDALSVVERGFKAIMPMTSGLVDAKKVFGPAIEQFKPSTQKLIADVMVAGSDMQSQFQDSSGLDFAEAGNPLREALGLKKNKLASEVSKQYTAESAKYGAESEQLASQYDDGSAKYYLSQFGRSVPVMAGTVAGGMVNPGIGAGILFGGVGSSGYADARADGASKEDAAIVGIGSGAIESITELPILKALKLGAKPAFKGVSKVLDKLLDTKAGRVAAVGGAEAVSELIANPSQMALEEVVLDKDYSIGDYGRAARDSVVLGFAMGTAISGLTPSTEKSPESLIRRAMDHNEAKTEKGFLDNLINTVETTKLKKLVPAKLEEFINSMGEQTVYLPIEAVQTYYQENGLDTEQAVFDLTDSDTAYAEAVATGGEIAIPLGRYVARVGTQAHTVLGESARLKAGQKVKPNTEMPDNADFEADIQAAIAEAKTNPTRAEDESGEVYDAVMGQLVDTTDRTAANQYAAVAQAFYKTMGARVGMKPMELFNQFKINIPGASQTKQTKAKVDATYDPILDAIRARKWFSDKDIHGPSLVSSLIAAGGIKPDSVGAAQLARMVDKGRVGLFNNNGMTLDDAVVWAKESGFAFDTSNEQAGLYDADAFDINALSDLIDRDIKRGVYAPENMNEKRAAFNESVDSMMEMLDAAGIDVNKMTNEEIKSLLMGEEQTFDGGVSIPDNNQSEAQAWDAPIVESVDEALPEATKVEAMAEPETAEQEQAVTLIEELVVAPEMPLEVAPKQEVIAETTKKVESTVKIDDFGEKIGGARKDTSEPTGQRLGKKEKTGEPKWLKKYVAIQSTKVPGEWGLYIVDSEKYIRKAIRNTFGSESEAMASAPLVEVSIKHRVTTKEDGTFAIIRRVTDTKRVVMKSGFVTDEAAKLYIAENAIELIEKRVTLGEEILPTTDDPMRIGPLRRENNKQATPEMFGEAFGFRGVEFGKWNNADERVDLMNRAYDGLLDLAEILNIPPKAISLNGDLALAFGARGQGLNSARAHYEDAKAVINLTKEGGAGALAHEWFHALDHYFSRQDGASPSEMITGADGTRSFKLPKNNDSLLSNAHARDSKMRPEVRQKFLNLIRSLSRRTENFQQDTARAEDLLKTAEDDFNAKLKEAIDYIGHERSYGKKTRKATEAELERYNELAIEAKTQPLRVEYAKPGSARKFSLGKPKHTNDALNEMDVIYKTVTGRSGFTGDYGVLKRLADSISYLSRWTAELASLQTDNTRQRTVSTDYRVSARKLDETRVTDYWQTNHEMGARAFSAFIEDSLASKNQTSEFMSYGSSGDFAQWAGPTGEEIAFPFPRGEERSHFNELFRDFFETLQTKQTDKGVMLYQTDRQAKTPLGDAKEIEVDGVMRPALNSDGKPIHDTVEGVQNFWKWFGDSKVVDAEGRPLVVYHGTTADIDAFDLSRAGEVGERFAAASFFTNNQEVAAGYSQRLDAEHGRLAGVEDELRSAYGKAVVEQFAATKAISGELTVDIKRQYDDAVTARRSRRKALFTNELPTEGANIIPVYLRSANPIEVDASGGFFFSTHEGAFTDAAKSGADSVIVRNVVDRANEFADGSGDVFAVFDPTQIKSATGNNGDFSESDNRILYQPAGGSARGSVNVRKQADGTIEFDIHLFKKANFSTFLHESGHAYLEIMQALAKREGAPADIVADWQKIKDYLGVKGDAELTVEQHEKFARSFEAYLREGKAPSSALKRAFASFKIWLTRIYKTATALDVELSDDIRGVMDRMLASEAEIQDAQKAQNLGALFKDRLAEDWDQDTFDAYVKQVQAVQAEVENEVAAQLLKAEQDAQAAWYKTELKQMQDDVALELSREPVYVAQQIMRTNKYGNGDASPFGEPIHLDKADLLDMYGSEYLKRMKGLYRIEGGISANEAAVLFGFPNGTALVEALVNAESFNTVVKAEAQARMDVKYPDPMKDGSLPQIAMNAVHSDKMADVLVKEINMLEKRSGKKPTVLSVMKEAARRMIAEKPLRSIRSDQYLHAEQKAGREAIEAAAKQDWEAARVARRMQLLNHQLFKASQDAKELAAKQHKYLRRFIDGDKRAQIGKLSEEHLNAIDAMLAGVDWRKGANKDTGRGKSWRDLTLNELNAIHDAVKEAYHGATIEGIIMDGDRKVNAAIVDGEMAQSVVDAHGVKPPHYGMETAVQKAAKEWTVIRGMLGAATDLARKLDGYKDGGSVWSNTVRIIHEAMNNRVLPALQKAQEREAEIYLKHYTKKELRQLGLKGRQFAGVPGEWSKEQILALGLNWGNEGNREAIQTQVKKPLTQPQIAKLLGSLDSRDWAFIQDVWEMIDSHWGEISDVAQKRKGLRPAKVEGAPFTIRTSDGKVLELKGGYYPLKGEADSNKTVNQSADEYYDSIRDGSFSKASTKDGHTIERVGFGGRTVRLDLGVISQHQRDVLRDIHLGDSVNYVYKTLNGNGFVGSVEDAGMLEYKKALDLWLKDVATGELPLNGWSEQFMRSLRTNFTASVLTFKPVSAAIQITGVMQSAVAIGHKSMLGGISRYISLSNAGSYVDETSNYMRMRNNTQVDAVEQALNARSSRYAEGKSHMLKWGYYMIARVQRIVDVATWLAAEKKGAEMFGDDRSKVIAYADDVVKRAQGSGSFEDKVSVQRGNAGNARQSELVRQFTVLMGYMLAKNNVVLEQAAKAKQKGGFAGAAQMSVAMVELFTVEIMILALIRGQWPDDEDGDGIWDDLFAYAGKESAMGLIGGFPGISGFASEIRGYDSKGILADLFEKIANTKTQIEQGDADKALAKSVVSTAGMVTGLPSGQVNKTIDALAAAEDGEDVALYEYLTGLRK